jgi:adenylate kinase
MRALLAGISGVNKNIVVANLLARLRAHGEVSASASADTIAPDPGELLTASIEDALAAQGNELAGVLAAFRPAYQLTAWKRAGQAVAEQIEAADPRHSLIAAHLTYYTSGRQFSLIDLPTIRRWRPDCIITLVDDMLDIHSALAQRDAERHTNFRLRLREILGWRSAEIAMADLLARNLYPERAAPHYVVSIKHPAEMLYRLIFARRQYPLVYSSFPITAIRYNPDLRAAVNDIRAELHRRFIVFDPLTLDEGTPQVFQKARAACADAVPEIIVTANEARWPLETDGALAEGRVVPYPMTLDPREALEVWDDMENQVRHRDLTMVEQAQCVAAYRITMGGRLSTGMYSELMYASHTAEPARPVLMYADPADGGLDHPFLRNFNHRTFQDTDEWFEAIRQITPGGEPDPQRPLF